MSSNARSQNLDRHDALTLLFFFFVLQNPALHSLIRSYPTLTPTMAFWDIHLGKLLLFLLATATSMGSSHTLTCKRQSTPCREADRRKCRATALSAMHSGGELPVVCEGVGVKEGTTDP